MIEPSVLILLKNECYWAPYVLKQCEGIFDSFVIYDVGSTDGTPNIIDWFVERNKHRAHILVRQLPHADPQTQGTFRNSMIVEGNRDSYFILDGDELYKPSDLNAIKAIATHLLNVNKINSKKRYGVVTRVEVTQDLSQQYLERRTHHRVYTKDAFWTGTHPGEAPFFKQNDKSELHFPALLCWHMHNTDRSPDDIKATSRIYRKNKRTYHPGREKGPLNLLKELPVLRQPINNFPTNPYLKKLQTALQHKV